MNKMRLSTAAWSTLAGAAAAAAERDVDDAKEEEEEEEEVDEEGGGGGEEEDRGREGEGDAARGGVVDVGVGEDAAKDNAATPSRSTRGRALSS